ncbi:MAG: hypothetical protein K6G83_06405 [Lachnospiraceae bacterium]|nr:hypothetical protein [Lachnospiraceae bacterium]
MKKGERIKTENGISCTLLKKLGRGGQAGVWEVVSDRDGKHYAYKVYKHNTNNIRSGIEALITLGALKDVDGRPLEELVLPLAIVEGENDSFGYLMELLDLKSYTTLKKAWSNPALYPSCQALCRIIRNLARVFQTLHFSYGMCYKDVNEGNIFFNPKTGEIRIIDNDNIGYSHRFTIKGTSGYMAPEVVLGGKPDHKSDRFSLAVFAYRLFTGGFPFEGPYTEKYCVEHNILPDDARKVIFGSDPVFVFHPKDRRNAIENSQDPRLRGQAAFYGKLPESVKALFLNTFVTNLPKERSAERASDEEWIRTFTELEEGLITCPVCRKTVFSGCTACFECGAPLGAPPIQKKHTVEFKVLSAGEAKRTITLSPGDELYGGSVSKNLPNTPLLKILFHKKEKILGIRNLSDSPWTVVLPDQTKNVVRSGQIEPLREGMLIRIIPRTAQLNVTAIRISF